MSEHGTISVMAQRKATGAKFKQIVVTLENEAQHREMKRLAQAWADEVERMTGARIAQPVSGYLRWLMKQDAERRAAK